MAYKFQRGEAILSGALLQEGNIEIESGFEFQMDEETVLDTSRNLTVAGMSGSGDLQAGGTVRLDGVEVTGALATDEMYFRDADDDLMKAVAIEDVRDYLIFDSVSGDATIAHGGALTIAAGAVENDMLAGAIASTKIDELNAFDTGDLAEGSNLYYTDARVHAALSVSDSNSIDMTYDDAGDFSAALRISGSQLEVVGEGLRLAAQAADGQTMELSNDSLSVLKVPNALSQGEGIAAFEFDGSSALTIGLSASVGGDGLAYSSGVLSLDLDELTAADVAVAADFIAFVDADDNSTKKESIADLVSAMAGAGLSATAGVLAVQGSSVALKADGDTLAEGYNYFADIGSSDAVAAVTLPASPTAGDVVHVKAGDLADDKYVRISVQGSHFIDGTESSIDLESPFAAVSLVYVASNDWRIV